MTEQRNPMNAEDPPRTVGEAIDHEAAKSTSAVKSERTSISAHMTFFLCGFMVVVFSVWSSVSTLDIVSMATGEVIPSTQVKTIQHLEGGIIREVFVREGENVKQGQLLMKLEPTASGADVSELQVRLRSLRADEARLKALIRGAKQPYFPPDLSKAYPELVRQAKTRFNVLRRRHLGEVVRQQQAVAQRKQEITEIKTRIRSAKAELKPVVEKFKLSKELMKDSLNTKFQVKDLEIRAIQLRGAIDTDQASLKRAKLALREAEAELKNIKNAFDEDNQSKFDEASLNRAELDARVKKFEASLKRTNVQSPVDGVIKTLHVFTVGGVLRPGDPIADIVPAGDRLVIEAKLPTQDIGYVAPGQLAVIKLASADAMRFGGLDGNVVSVSPDTLLSPEGQPFYKVRIETDKSYFESGKLKYKLFPGMQVMASIYTGQRTVLEYVIDPIRFSMSNAFQER